MACTTETAAPVDNNSAAAVTPGTLGCPQVLVRHNFNATRGPGFWEVDEQNCFAIGKSVFPAPVDFELYLASHPHSKLGASGTAVSQCFLDFLKNSQTSSLEFDALPHDKQDYVQRATISDYYFLMNTMRQATRGSLEAIAAMDLILNSTPVLPQSALDPDENTYSTRYSTPFAVDSQQWERELRANCALPTDTTPSHVLHRETRDNLVFLAFTEITIALLERDVETLKTRFVEGKAIYEVPKLWYKQWTSASRVPEPSLPLAGPSGFTNYLRENDAFFRRIRAEFDADLKSLKEQYAGHLALTPWLQGNQMGGWGQAAFILYGSSSSSTKTKMLAEFAALSPEAAMKRIAAAVDSKRNLTTQGDSASSWGNALRRQVRANRKLLAERLAEVYDVADCLHEDLEKGYPRTARGNQQRGMRVRGCMEKVNAMMEAWPPFDGTGFRADELPEDVEVMHRLLESSDPASRELGERLAQKRAKALASIAGTFAAECRSEVRVQNQKNREAQAALAQGIVITVATAGLGSWLAASKTALTAAVAANATAQVASLSTRVLMLNAVLLATDVYWLGDGIVSSMKSCNEYINKNLANPVVSPLGTDAPYCRKGEEALGTNDLQASLSPTAVSNYRACAFEASFSIGLNTLGLLPSAIGMRSALKGAK